MSVSLYGAWHRGRAEWVTLWLPEGLIPPPSVACSRDGEVVALGYLGDAASVLTRISNRMKRADRRAPAQRTMAQHLGVTQQSVSRYLRGSAPKLSDAGWRWVADQALRFDP